jgi:hypothetical protein
MFKCIPELLPHARVTEKQAALLLFLLDNGSLLCRKWSAAPCAKSNCYPRGGFVVPKGVLPDGLVVFGFQFVAVF